VIKRRRRFVAGNENDKIEINVFKSNDENLGVLAVPIRAAYHA
jgi:hypothetical protein